MCTRCVGDVLQIFHLPEGNHCTICLYVWQVNGIFYSEQLLTVPLVLRPWRRVNRRLNIF